MTRLTMTPAMVAGLQKLAETRLGTDSAATPSPTNSPATPSAPTAVTEEPCLDDPATGNPITHNQILDLWRCLRRLGHDDFSLEGLLRGAQVYTPPPPPKPEPSEEYKVLMARLRREQEERSYQRMLKQPSRTEAFSQQFPDAAARAHAFAEVNRPMRELDNGDDEVTYGDVQKQVIVIFNFLVSIIGVAVTIWIAARWWDITARIFLTLGGAIVVAIAEVAMYSGYVWRLGEAKSKTKEPHEIKEVLQTWVLGKDGSKEGEETSVLLDNELHTTDEGIRRRLRGLS
ncbi:hypothetical protein CCHL11_09178 [Colletotrichum chlorophyti]|uniref:Vacuolar ATPase assembly integral membrane protein VPH2 n=1 Tax=Colletotrichum chlorophyti TaxID=708187 RepID=A0A1Q8S8E3_9PEZI|nr:hypothetical protein CCHL11_09178 [Colletotrichum chlorophyti]